MAADHSRVTQVKEAKIMRVESQNLEDYLVADDVIDWHDPDVEKMAKELGRGLPDKLSMARELFKWVRDQIPHTKDINGRVVTCKASGVLRHQTGMCYAKSHLLAALLRANGIPAGFCYQVLTRDHPFTGLALHGLNGVYLEEEKKWVRVDARGNTGHINAQFDLNHEQLAYPMDPAAGEFIYDIIFKAPAREVTETLGKFTDFQEMWPHLPKDLRTQKDDHSNPR
jgi:transglutaminase-like putative cysteine protease